MAKRCAGWLLLWVLVGCAPVTPTQRLALPAAAAGEQVHFTLRSAGRKVMILTIENDGSHTRTTFVTTDDYAPAWLRAAGGTMVLWADASERRSVDGACSRSATDIPPIDPAAIIGPQPGYVLEPSTEHYVSSDGTPLWSDYSGTANIVNGTVRALNARGTGTVLLPDNTTRSDTYSWTYQRTPLREPLPLPPPPCAETGLNSFPLPIGAANRAVDGGVLTAAHPDEITKVAAALLSLMSEMGTVSTIDSTPARWVLQLHTPSSTYMIILSARSDAGTDIMVYRAD